MGSTKSVCRVWLNEAEEWSGDVTEMPELYLGDPLDQPIGSHSLIEWWQDCEGGIHWGGEGDLPEIEEGGWYRVTLGYDGDDEGLIEALDEVWGSELEPLIGEEVHQVRVEWEAYETRRQEARLQNGCAFYDVAPDGKGRCAIWRYGYSTAQNLLPQEGPDLPGARLEAVRDGHLAAADQPFSRWYRRLQVGQSSLRSRL